MNRALLESKMKLHGDNQSDLAKGIGISYSSLNQKINELGGAVFTKKEMEGIRERYKLSNVEFLSIFFPDYVSSEDTKDGG